MTEPYYPPGAFYFTVQVLGTGALAALATGLDASFQEVSGIRAEFDVEEVAEGGENRFVHRLPRPARYANLVLKRGVVTSDSFLTEWAGQTVGSGLALPILPQNLLLSLLDPAGLPLVAWTFVNAWPVRLEVDALDSQANKVLIETLELSYDYFERINLRSALALGTKLAQLAARLA